jgi:hypothetical protein
MRSRTLMAVVLPGLLLLSGCGLGGVYEMKGESFLSLDRAMALATTTADLWQLWEQAPTQEKIVVEEEILKGILQGSYSTYGKPREGLLQDLRSRASSEEVKKAVDDVLLQDQLAREAREAEEKRKRNARQLEERKRAEDIRLRLQEARERLIRTCAGRLDDKSAEEVKKLVDDWKQVGGLVENWRGVVVGVVERRSKPPCSDDLWELQKDDFAKFFGASVFYRAFGQPERKQFIGGDSIFGSGRYYFYYQCKDGTVQMEVNPDSLDKEGYILVSGLNIL